MARNSRPSSANQDKRWRWPFWHVLVVSQERDHRTLILAGDLLSRQSPYGGNIAQRPGVFDPMILLRKMKGIY